MIPEREREALMRLTMCAREECRICMYQKRCDFNFQCELATKNMNILAEALRKTENSSEKPNNCDDLQDWKDRMWAEAIVTEPTISKMEQVDKPQTEDGIMPEVKAEVRFDENNKTLWIKTDTVENYDRVIIEDGSNWCRIFYEECGECAHNKPRSNDEPQTDCAWR